MVHIILLIQYTGSSKTKHYFDCESVEDAVKYIISIYEDKLKKINSNLTHVTYNILDLYEYIDEVKIIFIGTF